MAFVTITNNAGQGLVKIVLNDYSDFRYTDEVTIKKSFVRSIGLGKSASFVELIFADGTKFQLTANVADYESFLKIDSIDGIAPNDNTDLYNKLIALL
jgi:hypothetical protein